MRANAKSPYFKKGSHINCFVCDDGVVDICFNSASPDVLTKHYMMIITDPDGNQKKFVSLQRDIIKVLTCHIWNMFVITEVRKRANIR